MSEIRVLLVSSHPVQYASPLYRLYQSDPRIDLTVAYCSLQGAEAARDPDFGTSFAWDVPLLNGYRWVHPPNRSLVSHSKGFLGLVNPGLWGFIRSSHFDVVVCYGYRSLSFWVAAMAAKFSGSALVFTTDAHSWEVRKGPSWKAALKRLIVPRILAFADAVLAPSSRTVKHLREMGLDDRNVFLTPYVVDNQFFARTGDGSRVQLREAWGIPNDASVALFVAKLVPWKRPQDLLEAAARLKGLHVVLVGSGVLRRELEALASDKGVADRVHFLGFINQSRLPAMYAAADFLVLPSDYEPFGVVVNEAFASGRPAIVSNACGAAGDLITEGETGFVFPPGDVLALRNCMQPFVRNAHLAKEMGDKARSRIEKWSPNDNVEAFAEACRSIVIRRMPRSRNARTAESVHAGNRDHAH